MTKDLNVLVPEIAAVNNKCNSRVGIASPAINKMSDISCNSAYNIYYIYNTIYDV